MATSQNVILNIYSFKVSELSRIGWPPESPDNHITYLSDNLNISF